MATASERYSQRVGASSKYSQTLSQQKQLKSQVIAQKKAENQAYQEFLETEEGQQYQAAKEYEQKQKEYQEARKLKESDGYYVLGNRKFSKSEYEIVGKDDDTPEIYELRAKSKEYKKSPYYDDTTASYIPHELEFKDDKLVQEQKRAVGGYSKNRTIYTPEVVEYLDDRKRTSYFTIVGKGSVKKTRTIEQVGDQTATTYKRDMGKYKEYGTPRDYTEQDFYKKFNPEQKKAYEKSQMQKGIYTTTQLKRASALTNEAQVKEYGRVITPTKSRLEVEAKVRGVTPFQLISASAFTVGEQQQRYGRVVTARGGRSQATYNKDKMIKVSFGDNNAYTLMQTEVYEKYKQGRRDLEVENIFAVTDAIKQGYVPEGFKAPEKEKAKVTQFLEKPILPSLSFDKEKAKEKISIKQAGNEMLKGAKLAVSDMTQPIRQLNATFISPLYTDLKERTTKIKSTLTTSPNDIKAPIEYILSPIGRKIKELSLSGYNIAEEKQQIYVEGGGIQSDTLKFEPRTFKSKSAELKYKQLEVSKGTLGIISGIGKYTEEKPKEAGRMILAGALLPSAQAGLIKAGVSAGIIKTVGVALGVTYTGTTTVGAALQPAGLQRYQYIGEASAPILYLGVGGLIPKTTTTIKSRVTTKKIGDTKTTFIRLKGEGKEFAYRTPSNKRAVIAFREGAAPKGVSNAMTIRFRPSDYAKINPKTGYKVTAIIRPKGYKPVKVFEKGYIKEGGIKRTILFEKSILTQTTLTGEPYQVFINGKTYPQKPKPLLTELKGKELIKGVTLRRIETTGLRPKFGEIIYQPTGYKEIGEIQTRLQIIEKPKFIVQDIVSNKVKVIPSRRIKTIGQETFIRKGKKGLWEEIAGTRVIAQISPEQQFFNTAYKLKNKPIQIINTGIQKELKVFDYTTRTRELFGFLDRPIKIKSPKMRLKNIEKPIKNIKTQGKKTSSSNQLVTTKQETYYQPITEYFKGAIKTQPIYSFEQETLQRPTSKPTQTTTKTMQNSLAISNKKTPFSYGRTPNLSSKTTPKLFTYSGTKIKSAFIPLSIQQSISKQSSALKQDTLLRQEPISIQKPIINQANISIQEPISIQQSISKQSSALKQDTLLRQEQILREDLLFRQDLEFRQKQDQRLREELKEVIRGGIDFGFGLPLQRKKPTKEKTEGYDVMIKETQKKIKKGKYKSKGYRKANKQPLSKKAAMGMGMDIVDTFTNRSFKIRKAKASGKRKRNLEQKYDRLKNKFRYAKKNPRVFVEKTGYAIDSYQEKQGIPYKAQKLRRAGLLQTKRRKARRIKFI